MLSPSCLRVLIDLSYPFNIRCLSASEGLVWWFGATRHGSVRDYSRACTMEGTGTAEERLGAGALPCLWGRLGQRRVGFDGARRGSGGEGRGGTRRLLVASFVARVEKTQSP